MGTVKQGTGESPLREEIIIGPSDTFSSKALVRDSSLYEKAAADRLGFWAEQAESLDWYRKWDVVLDWNNPPFAKWFVNGKINASVNCIDRHLKTQRKTKAALIWEGEPGDNITLTYQDLYREVNKCANVLKKLGVGRGDRVAIYMGMIPELPIVMLACARIGALHNVIFSGYSSDSIASRVNDCEAGLVVTADGGWRGGDIIPLKQNCDEALPKCPSVEKMLVVRRTGNDVTLEGGRDFWYHELMSEADTACEPEIMDAEDPLYILYTSGSAGKPKGVVHTTGGYLTGITSTHKYVFDIKDDDVFWCTADIGWTTGHSYVVYGPLANGCTTVMYEGSQDWPEKDRFWDIIEKHKVSIFYTAPTAIRASMRWGAEWFDKKDISSLRLLGTAGEPIAPETWMWYYKHIGGERCPIVDTWWQTETGMILIAPLPGVTSLKPGSIAKPFPGVEVAIVDVDGDPVPYGSGGFLVVKSPWPAMLRTFWGNHERYKEQYWSMYEGIYLTGDSARQDKDGYYWIAGRVDDIVNVGGHRLDTMEIEQVLVNHPVVAEVAVIGEAHELRGQAITAFVTLKEDAETSPNLVEILKEHVVKKIGALARPENIYIMAELPKTRSGKVVRRVLRDIAGGHKS
ncbi:MAG TPA: acetate--CoA ligase [Clostridia bacterium]|nr:acetate--CoA ligase [Clostridia bacterium]